MLVRGTSMCGMSSDGCVLSVATTNQRQMDSTTAQKIQTYHQRLKKFYENRLFNPDLKVMKEAGERVAHLQRAIEIRQQYPVIFRDRHPSIEEIERSEGIDSTEQERFHEPDFVHNQNLLRFYEEHPEKTFKNTIRAETIRSWMTWSRDRITFPDDGNRIRSTGCDPTDASDHT